MQLSFLIVTKNRPEDLDLTLRRLKSIIDLSIHEVLVFIDGCEKTETIIHNFDWVNWTVSKTSVSASPARRILYKKAKGIIFIGLDDDAHPISENFIEAVEREFNENENIGVLAFQEVRGLYKSDEEALRNLKFTESYLTNDFIGCGFAIKKSVYDKTNGFPEFIDIYGEEPCVALEVLNLGFNIKYVHNIAVNHRVDVEKRKQSGRNYFRFEKQLRNSLTYYLVYYPNPLLKVLKLLIHNFKKYAIKDFRYFKSFLKVFFLAIINLPNILKHRNPVKKSTLLKKQNLKSLKY